MSGERRGIDRERSVLTGLKAEGWLAFRAPASLGVADVIALRAGDKSRLIEVKSTAGGPYERFGPADRERLRVAGRVAGAEVFLVWWPSRGQARWIPESEWPKGRTL